MQAPAGRGGGAHVGANRHIHAEITGAGRCDRTDDEGHGGLPLQEDRDDHCHNGHEHAEYAIFPVQERGSALLNRQGNGTHGVIALVLTENSLELPEYVPYPDQAHQQCDGHRCVCLQHDVYLSYVILDFVAGLATGFC